MLNQCIDLLLTRTVIDENGPTVKPYIHERERTKEKGMTGENGRDTVKGMENYRCIHK